MITLEEILQTHFRCKKPFLKKPKRYADYTEYFTKKGGKAYDSLTLLLEDLAVLGALPRNVVEKAIDELDAIVRYEED